MNFKPGLIKVIGSLIIAFFITLAITNFFPAPRADSLEQEKLFSMIATPEPIVLLYLLLMFAALYVLWSLVEKEKILKKQEARLKRKK